MSVLLKRQVLTYYFQLVKISIIIIQNCYTNKIWSANNVRTSISTWKKKHIWRLDLRKAFSLHECGWHLTIPGCDIKEVKYDDIIEAKYDVLDRKVVGLVQVDKEIWRDIS